MRFEDPGRRGMSANGRRIALVGLGGALVVALLVTVIATVAAVQRSAPRSGVRTPGATAAASPSASPTSGVASAATPSPTNAPFVCANVSGSKSVYVFINADHQLYRVNGCSTPAPLTHLTDQTGVTPLAFSPAASHLLVILGGRDGSSSPDCEYVMNPQSGAMSAAVHCDAPENRGQASYPAFIGWLDEDTFLEAATQSDLTVKVLRYNATTLASATVTTLGWVADLATAANYSGIRLRGSNLFYGGYMSKSEGQAYLHRYSLTDGSDTKLVPLGIAGNGGCQAGNSPCTWTGPWDVSPDGAHIVYHNPGPTQSISDTSTEQGTPLYYANPDGSGATQALGPAQGGGFSQPYFSPDGAHVATTWSRTDQVQAAPGGAIVALPDGYHVAGSEGEGWRGDGAALFLAGPPDASYTVQYAIYTIATRRLTPLPIGSSDYLWAA